MSSNSASATSPIWPMLVSELKIGLRTNAFRVLAAIALLIGITVGGAPGRGVALSAYAAGEAAWQYIGLFATAWMSLVAVRESSLRTASLVYSKPQSNERLLLLRFVGGFVPLAGLAVSLFAGAILARLAGGQGLSGSSVYFIQFFRALGPILFAGAAAFCLAVLFESAITGSIAGLAWIILLAGRSFLPKLLFPAYTQNTLYFALIGMGLVLLAALFHRRNRRGAHSAPLWCKVAAPLLIILPITGLWRAAADGHDPQVRMNPHFVRMAAQRAELGKRAPGFTFPDQSGRFRSFTEFEGKILVIGIVSPGTSESALVLDRLDSIQRKYGSHGVQAVGICVSQDEGAAAALARGEGLSYPLLADIGTYHGPSGLEHSPAAESYEALFPPKIAVTDRRRRVRHFLTEPIAHEGPELEQTVKNRLEAEPQ